MSLPAFLAQLAQLERIGNAAQDVARARPLEDLASGEIVMVEVSPGVFASPPVRERPDGPRILRELYATREMGRDLRAQFKALGRQLGCK